MNRTRPRRLFGPSRPGRRIGLIHILAALATLAACTPRTEMWSPAESSRRNQVSWVEFHHAVSFDAGSSDMTPVERNTLDRFLGRIADGEGVRVSISATTGESALALRREGTVAAHLRERGFRPQLGNASAPAAASAVRVTVGRHIVTPPACPDWNKPAVGDPGNNVSSNFGCATTANLGLMIADPGALVRGYTAGPGDGEMLAKGVQNYRENKSPWLPATAGFEIKGSTGGDSKSGSGSGD